MAEATDFPLVESQEMDSNGLATTAVHEGTYIPLGQILLEDPSKGPSIFTALLSTYLEHINICRLLPHSPLELFSPSTSTTQMSDELYTDFLMLGLLEI